MPGSYLLLLELSSAREITVGQLGAFLFPTGWYAYVGSALSGLEQRVSRHLRPSSVRRWHLDYLRAVAPIRAVHMFPGRDRRECHLAMAVLALPGASIPAPGFGASDCRCPTHLVHFPERPALEAAWANEGLVPEQSRGRSVSPPTNGPCCHRGESRGPGGAGVSPAFAR